MLQMIDRIRHIFRTRTSNSNFQCGLCLTNPQSKVQLANCKRRKCLGLKARFPIVQPLATSAVIGASRLLSQLSKLSADEAQNLIRRALNSKHSA